MIHIGGILQERVVNAVDGQTVPIQIQILDRTTRTSQCAQTTRFKEIRLLPEKPDLFAWIVVPDEMLSPSPIRCVLGGRSHDFAVTIVPAGNRTTEGEVTVIPAQGLTMHVMLVPVVPGRPRASMTPPPLGSIPFDGVRTYVSTPQKSLPLAGNMLASMKAPVPITAVQKVEDEQTPFWPWVPWALADVDKARNQIPQAATIPVSVRAAFRCLMASPLPQKSRCLLVNRVVMWLSLEHSSTAVKAAVIARSTFWGRAVKGTASPNRACSRMRAIWRTRETV